MGITAGAVALWFLIPVILAFVSTGITLLICYLILKDINESKDD